MRELRMYSVSDRYIAFLRADERLNNVLDNKPTAPKHTRKYIGIVLHRDEHNYFIPFSSPKKTDYIRSADGLMEIRKSIVPIVRMVTTDTLSGQIELKGTLRISNMIPVPDTELTPYDLSAETDANYKQLVSKELKFIGQNEKQILKSAAVLYNQKTQADRLFASGKAPAYLDHVVDFKYAEKKCQEFERLHDLELAAPTRSSVRQQLQDIKADMGNNRLTERNFSRNAR